MVIFNGLLGKKGCDFLEKKGEMAPRQARCRELGVGTSASSVGGVDLGMDTSASSVY